MLENRASVIPRTVSSNELRKIARFLKSEVIQNRSNTISLTLQAQLLTFWYALYDLVEVLEHPEQPLTIDNAVYYLEVKTISENDPLEVGATKAWSFCLIEQPAGSESLGKIRIYIPEVLGYERDPARLAGLIHEVMEEIVLRQKFPELSGKTGDLLRHWIAFVLEAIAGGEILTLFPDTPLPARVNDELFSLERQVRMVQGLEERHRAPGAWGQIYPRGAFFPRLESYLPKFVKALAVKANDVDLKKNRAAISDEPPTRKRAKPALIGLPPADSAFETRTSATAKGPAQGYVERMAAEGHSSVVIHNGLGEIKEYLLIPEARLAAVDGLLTLKDDELHWASSYRRGRIGGQATDRQFPGQKTFLTSKPVSVKVKSLEFKIEVSPYDSPDGEGQGGLRPVLRLMGSSHGSYWFRFKEDFYAGRYRGEFTDYGLSDLDSRHFYVRVTEKNGLYQYEFRNYGQNGTLIQWQVPDSTSHGSAMNTLSFMGTGLAWDYFKSFVRWIKRRIDGRLPAQQAAKLVLRAV